jgi:3-methyladenine DNA glycosylase AlkD
MGRYRVGRPARMPDFDALFTALRGACDPRRQVYLASYFAPRARSEASAARDRYRGLTAVAARKVALRFADDFRLPDLVALLASDVDEHRFAALEMLVRRYETGDAAAQARIARLYIRNLRHVDHWVLVDTSAPYILGHHLLHRSRRLLFRLAASKDFVRRRIAIVATAAFIRAGDFDDTLRIAARLARDENELVQRAVGWMLREVGKRSQTAVLRFLARHAPVMPRLMLRQAVDRLPAAHRGRLLGRA